MKHLILLFCLFGFITANTAKAQTSPDSLIHKQLLHQKKILSLNEEQFEEYKILTDKYFAKMGNLATTTKDTSVFKIAVNKLQQSQVAELAALLTPQQMEVYRKMVETGWKNFEKKASENNISIYGKADGGSQ